MTKTATGWNFAKWWFASCFLILGTGALAEVGTTSSGQQRASGLQDHPTLTTFNGVTWVAWIDTNDSRYFNVTRAMVARLNANGTPIDQPAVALPFVADKDQPPALGVCAGELWIAWSATVPNLGPRVAMAPLSVGAQGIEIGTVSTFAGPSTLGVAMAATPSGCLAAWAGTGGVKGLKLPLASGAAPTAIASGVFGNLQLAFDGTRYVVLGDTPTSLRGFFIDPSTLQATAVQTWATLSDPPLRTSLAAGDGIIVAGWTNDAREQQLLWLSLAGNVVSGPLTVDAGMTSAYVPALATRDGGFSLLVAGRNNPSDDVLTLTQLDLDGGVQSGPQSLPLVFGYLPDLGSVALREVPGGLLALSAYGDGAPEKLDIFAHVIDGGVAAPVVVSTGSAAQHGPFIEAFGSEVLAAYTEARTPAAFSTTVQYVDRPRFTRFAPWGVLRDPDGVALEVSPSPSDGSSNVVGAMRTSTGWRVAWLDDVRNDLWTVNVDGATGALGTPVQLFASTSVERAGIAGDATGALVIGGSSSSALAQRFDAQGNPVGAAITLPSAFNDHIDKLGVAMGGGGWVVANVSYGGSTSTVTLQTLSSAGALGAATTRTYGVPGTLERQAPALAWNGTEWLMAVPSSSSSVSLERFSASLASLGTAALETWANVPKMVAVAPSFNGGWFVASREFGPAGDAIHLRAFSGVLDSPSDVVLAEGRGLAWPSLTVVDAGVVGVAWMKLVDEAPFSTWRMRLAHWPASPSSEPDGGTDAGTTDGGSFDGGNENPSDAGDGGSSDGGNENPSDAGDGGSSDGGEADPPDAGDASGVPPEGCTCGGVPGAGGVLCLLAALAFRRRRSI